MTICKEINTKYYCRLLTFPPGGFSSIGPLSPIPYLLSHPYKYSYSTFLPITHLMSLYMHAPPLDSYLVLPNHSPALHPGPAVHDSIRINLISAFCPIDTCLADIFVRISASDNTHMPNGRAIVDPKGISIPAICSSSLELFYSRSNQNEYWNHSRARRDEFNSSRHRICR